MITLTVVLISAFALYTKQQTTVKTDVGKLPERFLDYKAACAKENGIEASDALKIWTDPDYPANNQSLKCFYACMSVELGIITDGKLDNVDFTLMLRHYDNTTQLKEIGDKCADIPPNNDQCELAYQLLSCVAKTVLG